MTTTDKIYNDKEGVPEHLLHLWTRSSEHLKHLYDDQKNALPSLLSQYQDIFTRNSDEIGRTDRVTHMINTGTAIPIRQRSRRMPIGKREMERQEVTRMLEKGIIAPLKSPCASNILLVRKKDGMTRFCCGLPHAQRRHSKGYLSPAKST